MARSIDWNEIEERYGEPGETLADVFARKLNELGSMERLAGEFGTSYVTIFYKCAQLGVQKRFSYYVATEADRA